MTHIWTMALTVVGVLVMFGIYGVEWKQNKPKHEQQ
jgi:hypothetical protein